MAPSCPEEVDVFTVPHSRMKELVCKYLDMLTATNFSNVVHLTTLLETLIRTFQEFIAHEQIENQFIMKKLKYKLRSLSIQNTAVCNCHKDNTLVDMLKFLQDGYKCTKKSEADRNNYGLQLRQALENFTETFLPHMEEEEEVFQPLLMQHFTFEELKQIKATVLQQHFNMETEDVQEKFVAENKSKTVEEDVADNVTTPNNCLSIYNLPDEVMLKVFSHLNPKELSRSAQVSKRWNSLAMDSSLWTELYPVSWAKGDWNAECGVYEEDTVNVEERLNAKSYDEDADVDETDDWDSEAREIQYQSAMLTSMCKYLLPRVGRTIKHCDLAYSKGLTNGSLYKVLSLCPNLEYLDLTQTRVSDLGFKGFKKEGSGKKLRHLDLSGCLYITDRTLQLLSSAFGQIPCHMTDTGQPKADHVTSTESPMMQQAKEQVSENQGCPNCEENRRNASSCPVKGKSHENYQKHLSKESQESRGESSKYQDEGSLNGKKCCGRKRSECTDVSDGPLRDGFCKVNKCVSSEDLNTGTCTVPHCCQNATQEKHGCCLDNREKCDVETPLDEEFDKKHDERFDNENTESQDRSWIKQGKGHSVERSRTLIADLSTCPTNDRTPTACSDMQHNVERRQDEKNIKNLTEIGYVDIEEVPDMNIIRPELNLGQTFLLDQPFLPSVNKGSDGDCELTLKTLKPARTSQKNDRINKPERTEGELSRPVEFLSLSGCYQITDVGLNYLTGNGGLPRLRYLDLSGCLNIAGEAVTELVDTSPYLDPAQLFYCDNILDGPYADVASGCQNLQCNSRICCRCGE